jgi:3-methyladenine DNA glycosylase AlkD
LAKPGMDYAQVISLLNALANPDNAGGMARFGINPENILGISMPEIKKLAKQAGRDHTLALRLWESGIHEARILASLVDEPSAVTEEQADKWVRDLDSWDVCDQLCMNLLWITPFAYNKCFEWASRDEEFVKRAGFALMAHLAWRDKDAPDERIAGFLPVIKKEATDERNFVKKAVNWALRQIGKRNLALNKQAIATAREIQSLDSKSARWIAADALRELESEAVQSRLAGG